MASAKSARLRAARAEIESRADLSARLKALGPLGRQQRNEVACALIGHSRIVSTCFGYVHCGRCGAQIGDALGGSYDGSTNFIVGCGCEQCARNLAAMGWRDRIYAAGAAGRKGK